MAAARVPPADSARSLPPARAAPAGIRPGRRVPVSVLARSRCRERHLKTLASGRLGSLVVHIVRSTAS